jgi:hypothetical protein
MRIRSDTVATLTVYGDSAVLLCGECSVDHVSGFKFYCRVEDRGEPGRGKDAFYLQIYDYEGNPYYFAGAVLGGGNIQIHTTGDEIAGNPGEAAGGVGRSKLEYSGSIQLTDAVHQNRLVLVQNSPNPFLTETTISYSTSSPAHVSLEIYSKTGRLVRTLVDDEQVSGRHQVVWDGLNESGVEVPQGVYFCRLQAGTYFISSKLILVR